MDESKIKEEAPLLFSLDKKNIHRVPDGFFDAMEGEICKQVITKTTVRFERTKWWFEFSAAAVLVLGVLIGAAIYFPFRSENANTSVSSVSSVSETSAAVYYPLL